MNLQVQSDQSQSVWHTAQQRWNWLQHQPYLYQQPNVYQHPNIYQQPNSYQQPNAYQQPSAYQQPDSFNQLNAHQQPSVYQQQNSFNQLNAHQQPNAYHQPNVYHQPNANHQPNVYQEPEWHVSHQPSQGHHHHQPQEQHDQQPQQHYQQPQYTYNMQPQHIQQQKPQSQQQANVSSENPPSKSAEILSTTVIVSAPKHDTQEHEEGNKKITKLEGCSRTEDKKDISSEKGTDDQASTAKAWIFVKQIGSRIASVLGTEKENNSEDEQNADNVEQDTSNQVGNSVISKGVTTLARAVSDVSEISLSEGRDTNGTNKQKSKSSDVVEAKPTDENLSRGQKIWNFIKEQWKQISAIVLILLDVIFDWVEYGDMSSEGEWSTSNKKETVSCTARGDNLAEKFMIFTVLGTLFAMVQIANIIYQIYTEKKEGEAKKVMDGRTEVVISRVLEEIPQILLIVAFRTECDISCDKYRGKDVRAAISATFSVLNSTWRHVVATPKTKGKDCGEKCLRCCCPCCFFTCRCYPFGQIFSFECCAMKCIDWGCESDFLLYVVRCYPSHLDPPKEKYFECCARSMELNFLTRMFMGILMKVHVFAYVVYLLNLICGIGFYFFLDELVNSLF